MNRNTETQSGKGFKLQTLKAIDLFFDAVNLYGKDAKIFIATEKIGDVYLKIENKTEIGEVKNYSSTHSINSDAIKNTLINFVDTYIKLKQADVIFSFYSTADKKKSDSYNLKRPVLDYIQKHDYSDEIIKIVSEKIIGYYKSKYTKAKGNIDVIEAFTKDEWITFLSKIGWNFNISGNYELSKELINKSEEIIRKHINPDYLSLNGIAEFVVYKIRDELENKLETNSYSSLFEFRDYENVFLYELANRSFDRNRNYGKFLKLKDKHFEISNELFYFTLYEKKLIREFTDQFLYTENRNFIFLSGKSAQGKTILARQIAENLEKEDYLCLYSELNDKSNLIELNLESIARENDKVFCIISKSHLNLGLIKEIIEHQAKYPKIKFLFESRVIDKTIDENSDVLKSENLVCRELSFNNETHFIEKSKGILQTHLGLDKVSRIDIKTLIKQIGRNFLFLFEYIKVLKSDIENSKFETIEKKNS